ncbi:MAG: colicin V synthesis protein [Bradyrhizobium sp. 35-63-5]|nr:MAG: colicin V synthesis protein [Bradyrhizobium sp. 35-63-5]
MPTHLFTMLDVLLLVVMLISGLLAMIRGFMREILSIAAWLIAAIAAVYLAGRLQPTVKSVINAGDTATTLIAGGAVFLVVLLIVSVITIRISDMVLDSRVGALDRTLGFLFGLGRGLLIVVVAYAFFDWLVPVRKPEWIGGAKSAVVLRGAGDWLKGLLPDDLDKTISKFKKSKPDEQEPPDAGPTQR